MSAKAPDHAAGCRFDDVTNTTTSSTIPHDEHEEKKGGKFSGSSDAFLSYAPRHTLEIHGARGPICVCFVVLVLVRTTYVR